MKKLFVWKGITKEGVYEKGQIEAPNIRLARAYLKEKGIASLIYVKQNSLLTYFRFNRQDKLKFPELTLFFKHLTTLLEAGIPLIKALKTIQTHFSSEPFKKWIQEIYLEVAAGYPLSNSLKHYPQFIPSMVCEWIEAGEQTGKIETILTRLVAERERQWQYRQKIKSLLIYPSFVILMATILVMALFIWVIPQWVTLFAGSKVSLPFLTQMLLLISTELRNDSWAIVLCAILGGITLRPLLKKKWFYRKWSRLPWKIPYVRGLYRDHFLMNWSQLLALSLSAGVPLITALQSLKNMDPSLSMQSSLRSILLSLETGHSFTAAVHKAPQFPPLIAQMISIGEESGHLEEMIQKAGEFYQAEFERKLRNLLQLLEPFIITILGLIVGLIVMGMYLPIFQLGDISGAF